MFPFKTSISLERKNKQALYLQLSTQLMQLIKAGALSSGIKLPGSRRLADLLGLHRNTVVMAYDELIAQGWICVVPSKGTFVNTDLPIVKQRPLVKGTDTTTRKKIAGFHFYERPNLNRNDVVDVPKILFLDEGVPDNRLAPIETLAKTYRNLVAKAYNRKYLSYGSIYGNNHLRETLVGYLNDTRGLQVTKDNILITRGSQMGMYLATQLLLQKESLVVVGQTNYRTMDHTCEEAGARLLRVAVDEEGIVVNQIAAICQTIRISAVYVTSHHHHPTTVTMSAKRRMELLTLANEHKFAILEDDYDYDFHYDNAPILPLASHDTNNNVIYTGALCKIVAPGIRIGYLVASKDFIDAAAQLRVIIDRQGDSLLELAMSQMINAGDIHRHTQKALRIYKKRRDFCCTLLSEKLSAYFSFQIPEGGMAIWLLLDKKYKWNHVTTEALKHGLQFPDWKRYDALQAGHNGIRFGFASHTEEEMEVIIDKLVIVMNDLNRN